MKIWEVIGPNPLQAEKKRIDDEQQNLTQKKKSLKVRTVQQNLSKAMKDRNESAQMP